MPRHQVNEYRQGDYLALSPDQQVRVLACALARARIERSLAMWKVIAWLGRFARRLFGRRAISSMAKTACVVS